MVVAVEDSDDTVEAAGIYGLGSVTVEEQPFGVIDHLQGLGAVRTGPHLHMRGGQPERAPDLVQVQRLGLLAFANDEQALERLALRCLAVKVARLLAFLRLVVAPHLPACRSVRRVQAVAAWPR